MKFKSYKGKSVLVGAKVFTFKKDIEEVKDKHLQAALKKAQDVEEVKSKSKEA